MLTEEEGSLLKTLKEAGGPVTTAAISVIRGGGRYKDIAKIMESLTDRQYVYRVRNKAQNITYSLSLKGVEYVNSQSE